MYSEEHGANIQLIFGKRHHFTKEKCNIAAYVTQTPTYNSKRQPHHLLLLLKNHRIKVSALQIDYGRVDLH